MPFETCQLHFEWPTGIGWHRPSLLMVGGHPLAAVSTQTQASTAECSSESSNHSCHEYPNSNGNQLIAGAATLVATKTLALAGPGKPPARCVVCIPKLWLCAMVHGWWANVANLYFTIRG